MKQKIILELSTERKENFVVPFVQCVCIMLKFNTSRPRGGIKHSYSVYLWKGNQYKIPLLYLPNDHKRPIEKINKYV